MKNTWDLMKEVAKDEVRKRGDYTELAELKKVEREANKRLGYKSKLDRLVENPPKHLKPEPILKYIDRVKDGGDPFRYASYADGQEKSDITGQKNPNYNALPKDMFQRILPLPKNKKVKFEPLNLPFLPTEFDEPKPKPRKEIKRPKAEGIVSVLNLNRLG